MRRFPHSQLLKMDRLVYPLLLDLGAYGLLKKVDLFLMRCVVYKTPSQRVWTFYFLVASPMEVSLQTSRIGLDSDTGFQDTAGQVKGF